MAGTFGTADGVYGGINSERGIRHDRRVLAIDAHRLLGLAMARARRGWIPALGGPVAVWALTATMTASVLLVYLLATRSIAAAPGPFTIPWPVLAALFGLAEVFAIHLQFRKDAHTYSLSEVPLVLGLFFAPPGELLAAQAVGAGIALWLHRGQPALKLLFNLANFALATTVALLIFHLFLRHAAPDPLGPPAWLGVFVAMITADLLLALMVVLAISLSEGTPPHLPRLVTTGTVFTAANTCLALVMVALLWLHPVTTVLPLALAFVLVMAYKAYESSEQRSQRMEVLYQSSRVAQTTLDPGELVVQVLRQAREMFKVDIAEVVTLPLPGEVTALRTTLGPGDRLEVMVPELLDPLQGVWATVAAEQRIVRLGRPIEDGPVREHYEARGIEDLMMAPLRSKESVVGTMLVAGRRSDYQSFAADDERMFETLTNTVSVSLQNTRLVDNLRRQAEEDALTSLANRAAFRRALAGAVDARKPGEHMAVLIMDLDRFKEVNDTLGHHTGDVLLREIANRLRATVPPWATLARLSGDEFAVLIPPGHERATAETVAASIVASLRRPISVMEVTLEVGASIGIAMAPEHGELADELIQHADVAMYLAKEGHTGYETYDRARDPYSPERLALVGELRRAMDERSLGVAFQPKARVSDGRIVGAEALVRWDHPVRGKLAPDRFVAMAEQTGLIRPLTLHVLDLAIAQCVEWRRVDPAMSVAVNLSVRNLLDLELPRDIAAMLETHGLPAHALELEITESVIMADPVRTETVLGRLHEMGISIAIDDFGTGVSSYERLQRLPVDVIKIDRAFVMSMGTDAKPRAIVRSIVELCRNLGLGVVAEGVEDAEAWEQLRQLGCDVAQGYHLSPPVDAAAMRRFVTAPTGSADPDVTGTEASPPVATRRRATQAAGGTPGAPADAAGVHIPLARHPMRHAVH